MPRKDGTGPCNQGRKGGRGKGGGRGQGGGQGKGRNCPPGNRSDSGRGRGRGRGGNQAAEAADTGNRPNRLNGQIPPRRDKPNNR
jgi:hypothetical protein